MGAQKGHKVSFETRLKISQANQGQARSENLMKVLKSRTGVNNPMYGRKHTDVAKNKVKLTKLEQKNPNWKGEGIKDLEAIHNFVRRRKPQTDYCENCGKLKKLELANIKNHIYTRKIEDYKYLCRSCHIKLDIEGGFR